MIYTIFLYQASSGLLIYDQNFQKLDKGNIELFGSFFAAIKSFVTELVLDGSKELKNIDLGEYSIVISSIKRFDVDIVIITDKEDIKIVNKLLPKIIKLLNQFEDQFLLWDGDRSEFNILELPLTDLVTANNKDARKSLIEKPDQILKSIWAQRKQISEETRENLIQERDLLIYKIEKSPLLPSNLSMSENVVQLSEQLRDEDTFLRYQNEVNRLKNEIKDAKFKLKHYLTNMKTSLNHAIEKLGTKLISAGDYKDTYLSLYSFSTKLRLLKDNGWEIYRGMANKLIDKENVPDKEISQTIHSILKMSENIEEYLD
ncbi:MAG: hypothetical protein KGD66_05265 [Candidatus Lokiarchaeota archaeon]|nr:hypothetical protein [Candidatus Lokiarchaeota archaeon]